ncbi:MAG: propanediol utilization protein [Bacillota bacterium]
MKRKARCPASCGELLQGVIGDSEKLISYAVNVFSEVVIEESNTAYRDHRRTKAVEAMYKTLEYYGEPSSVGDTLSITIDSDIPVAKGMASSTADIAAAICATAALLGKMPNEDELAKLCVSVEPTDSTIFKALTLFDHLQGKRIRTFEWIPDLAVLVLESDQILDTQEFRKHDYSRMRSDNQLVVERAYHLFENSYLSKDRKAFGEAATISALANQNIIHKPKLEEIIEISTKRGCYGVNVAHSGTVVGVLYDDGQTEIEALIEDLRRKNIFISYPSYYTTRIVQGGVRIINI